MTNFLRMLAIALSVSLVLTGCGYKREVNDLLIAVGMGLDKSDEGYFVSIQVVDPAEVANKGSGRAPVTVYKGSGRTVFEAVRRMTSTTARKIYFAHMRMVLIGEELARSEGIGNVIEFISRDHEFRADYYLAIAKNNTASKLLGQLTAIEKIPANKLFTSLETSSKSWAATGTVQMDELITDLMTEGKSPSITGVEYVGDPVKGSKKENVEVSEAYARLRYTGMGVFRKDKLIGWLNESESIGFNFLSRNVHNSVRAIPCPGKEGALSIELFRSTHKVKLVWVQNSPRLDIEVRAKGNVGELQCVLDVTDPNTVHQLEEKTAQSMERDIQAAIKKSISLDADYIGLGTAIHRTDPEAWVQLKRNWPKRMATLPMDVHVEVNLFGTGQTNKSFLEQIKE